MSEQFVAKPTFRQRTLTFRNGLIALLITFTAVTFTVKQFNFFGIDLSVTLFVQSFHSGWFDTVMRFLTLLGNQKIAILSAAIFCGLFLVIRKYKAGSMLLLSGGGVLVLSQILKKVVARHRPEGLIKILEIHPKADSFPSGHVLFYVGVYGFLMYLTYSQLKKGALRTVLILFLSLMLLGIGLSRIYLGAHWFSDVLGAYLLGGIWLMIMIWVYNRLRLQR